MMGQLLLHSILLSYFTSKIFHFFFQKIRENAQLLVRKKVGGGHLIFIFRGEFTYEGNQRNVDTHQHTMNTKHKVLNGTLNLFHSRKLNIWKCRNKKKQNHTEVHITDVLQSRHDRKTGNACGIQGNSNMNPPLCSMRI